MYDCIDLFLTNSYRSFHNTNVISTGLPDFHKMVVTVMKTTLPKAKPKQIFYREFQGINIILNLLEKDSISTVLTMINIF